MKQGYIPQKQAEAKKSVPHKRASNKVMLATLVSVVIIAAVGAVVALGGNQKKIDAAAIVQKFIDAGMPVENVVAYNSKTDPNNLLGKPNSYTSKVSFADSRVEQIGSDPEGGTVEVFNNKTDATARNEYVSSFSGTIFGSYIYQADNIVARFSYKLTQEQADQYNAILKRK